ncbi:MAG: hypothetical protein JW709_07600 [Sedimentisphaerales bacterium]|nr:hypothetical protein [Sedimentisphaerales bacterium]
MFEYNNTETIPFNKNITDGMASWVQPRSDLDTSGILDPFVTSEQSDLVSGAPIVHGDKKKIIDFLVEGFRSGILGLYTLTQINLARISTDNQYTDPFPSHVLSAMIERPGITATVSKDLIRPRSKVQLDSLLGPSGAYLTWIAMEEEGD